MVVDDVQAAAALNDVEGEEIFMQMVAGVFTGGEVLLQQHERQAGVSAARQGGGEEFAGEGH